MVAVFRSWRALGECFGGVICVVVAGCSAPALDRSLPAPNGENIDEVQGNNLAGTNLAGTNLAGTNLAGTNSGVDIHGTGAGQSMLYSGEDVWMPKTGQCIVLGIGSTAFAKLLGQQSANANVSIALGKLPWGFAKSKNGPVALSAWEAIVWGDKTYCTFVIVSPTNSTWTGVAGFEQSIFRWNPPPTQSMQISGIEESLKYDSTRS